MKNNHKIMMKNDFQISVVAICLLGEIPRV